MLFGTTNCLSAQKQPDYECSEHLHARECVCYVDMEVKIAGGCAIQLKTWRAFGQFEG